MRAGPSSRLSPLAAEPVLRPPSVSVRPFGVGSAGEPSFASSTHTLEPRNAARGHSFGSVAAGLPIQRNGGAEKDPFLGVPRELNDAFLFDLDLVSLFRMRAASRSRKQFVDSFLDRYLGGLVEHLPIILGLLTLESRQAIPMRALIGGLRYYRNFFLADWELVRSALGRLKALEKRYATLDELVRDIEGDLMGRAPFEEPTDREGQAREVHRLLELIDYATEDRTTLARGEPAASLFSKTLIKMLEHYGDEYRPSLLSLLDQLIKRQRERLGALMRGVPVNISELFHATTEGNFLSIASGVIETRMDRDHKPFTGAYVGPDPSLYGKVAFGFPAALKDRFDYHDEPNDQGDGNFGFKEPLVVNPRHQEVEGRFLAALLTSLGPLVRDRKSFVRALDKLIRLRLEDGKWVLFFVPAMREVPTAYFLANQIEKVVPEADTKACSAAAEAGWRVIEDVGGSAELNRGDVTGVNIIAPLEGELDLWGGSVTLESIAESMRSAGIGIVGAHLIDLSDAKVELDYLNLIDS